jgi:mannan endo-1,4-beta-mannosidase
MALEPGFVECRGMEFVLNGASFPVVGVNCYFLAWCGDGAREATLESIRGTGANVIRTMAFRNSVARPSTEPCFQFGSAEGIVINDGPDGLERLDALISAAEQQEFRLILPLVNYWDDFGGMSTYLEWLFPGENLPVEEFYRRPEARRAYRNWLGHVLNRRNSINGQWYKDSPAIFAWELANEPRCPIPGGQELLLDWTREMSQFVKENDPHHLLALGDEGFLRHAHPPNHLYTGQYGVDFEATLGIPEIDFGTYHFYPAPSQMNVGLDFARIWISDHIASARRANKPAILEEYGIRIGDYGVNSAAVRGQWYRRWQDLVYTGGGGGDLLWTVGSEHPDVAGFHDEYTVYAEAMGQRRPS